MLPRRIGTCQYRRNLLEEGGIAEKDMFNRCEKQTPNEYGDNPKQKWSVKGLYRAKHERLPLGGGDVTEAGRQREGGGGEMRLGN